MQKINFYQPLITNLDPNKHLPLNNDNMTFWRVILCIIFPPLAVIDKGCGSILLVFILTILGWIPGVIAALVINNK